MAMGHATVLPLPHLEGGAPALIIRNTFVDCHAEDFKPRGLVRSGSCPAELSCLKLDAPQRPAEGHESKESSLGNAETASSEGEGATAHIASKDTSPPDWVDSSSSEDEDDELVNALTRAATHDALRNSPWRLSPLREKKEDTLTPTPKASCSLADSSSSDAAASTSEGKAGSKFKRAKESGAALREMEPLSDTDSDSSSDQEDVESMVQMLSTVPRTLHWSSSSSSSSSSESSDSEKDAPKLRLDEEATENASLNVSVNTAADNIDSPLMTLPENTLPASYAQPGRAPERPESCMDSYDDDEDILRSPQAQMLKCKTSRNGMHRVCWVVDARKLRANDKQAVSPPFELHLGHGERKQAATFKMMIYPKCSGDAAQGAGCFKKAQGFGVIQVKCEAELSEEFAQVTYRMSIGSGSKAQTPRAGTHNFAHNAVCGLPKGKDLWNFNSVVHNGPMIFLVVLEMGTQPYR
mmetsp:Transcript_98930/g.175267  ORF Transcript_98930/g.175267 Transcript_98930/m.175267 type:complete len:467 (+) Transcript_98930:45-1445(+)